MNLPPQYTESNVSFARMVSVLGRSLCLHVDRCWAQRLSLSSAQSAPCADGCFHRAKRGTAPETTRSCGKWQFLSITKTSGLRNKHAFIWIFFCSSSMASCWAALRAARRSSRSLWKEHESWLAIIHCKLLNQLDEDWCRKCIYQI